MYEVKHSPRGLSAIVELLVMYKLKCVDVYFILFSCSHCVLLYEHHYNKITSCTLA